MPIIKKNIEIKTNANIEDNEINVYSHETIKNIIKYLNTYIEKISIDKKILYFSFYNSKKYLLKNYSCLNKKNIVIVDINYFKIDDIERYIIKQKPKYIFINYYKLTSNRRNLLVMEEKLGYVLNKIEEYSKKYNVKFIVAINKED